ncbi:kinase-like protein [Rhizophagus irregularis]|uniref:Kinase-like protein n=1 Tax=Rhizophagus irregularis TaxID=588596 RepID=A0A2N0Q3R6_9GLOM|nr:kinase-like protein [Rhizophagus irregularis]
MSFLKSLKLKLIKVIEKNSPNVIKTKDSNENEINDYNNWLEKSINNENIKYFEYSDFENVRSIGRGTFGSVVRANLKNNNEFYALKSFNNEEEALFKIIRELELHRIITHENILQFYGVTKIETGIIHMNKYVLVLEYADSGTLDTYLNEHFNKLNWNDKHNLALQLANAVSYLHDYDIIHRDLHANNILVHQKSIKLADFGLSKKTNKKSSNTLHIFGVIPYMDPKVFHTEDYELNKKSDVYSVGMLLWQISSGCRPFCTEGYNAKLGLAIIYGQREAPIDGTPDEYSECWNYEPEKRPDMREVATILKQLKSSSDDMILKSLKSSNKKDDDRNNATKWIKEALVNRIVNSISYKELKNPESLDKGGFGHIMKATWTKSNNYVVYKRLTNTIAVKHDILDAFIHELQIHLRLDYSDRIIRCLGISQDDTTKEFLLVMQYADGGNLKNYLKNNFKSLTWNNKKRLAYQIADGLNYLHNENVLHRDLHSKNIVIHENNAKITDFGISKVQTNQNNQHSSVYMGNFGCIAYLEPKRILDPKFPYTESSDIYSFGVLMWEISSGHSPFKDNVSNNERYALAIAINSGVREVTIPGTPREYEELYKNCWNKEPKERPTIIKILCEFSKMGFGVNVSKNKSLEESTNKQTSDFSDLQTDLFIQTKKLQD